MLPTDLNTAVRVLENTIVLLTFLTYSCIQYIFESENIPTSFGMRYVRFTFFLISMQQTQSFHPKRIVKFPASECSALIQESDFYFVVPQVFML